MTDRYIPKTPLTYSILKSIIDKVERWINADFIDQGLEERINYYVCESFFYDKLNFPDFPLLIINKPISKDENAKIWFDEEKNELFSNIEQSAEEYLTLYIELEHIINIETTKLENKLYNDIKEELNELNLQETL
jgi:hypothetical protein